MLLNLAFHFDSLHLFFCWWWSSFFTSLFSNSDSSSHETVQAPIENTSGSSTCKAPGSALKCSLTQQAITVSPPASKTYRGACTASALVNTCYKAFSPSLAPSRSALLCPTENVTKTVFFPFWFSFRVKILETDFYSTGGSFRSILST